MAKVKYRKNVSKVMQDKSKENNLSIIRPSYRILILAVIIFLIVFAFWGVFSHTNFNLEATGVVVTKGAASDHYSNVEGVVSKVLINTSSAVSKGQPVFEIECSDGHIENYCSPVNGYLVNSYLYQGSAVKKGQQVACFRSYESTLMSNMKDAYDDSNSVSDKDKRYVISYVDYYNGLVLQPGMDALITIDNSINTTSVKAKIVAVSPISSNEEMYAQLGFQKIVERFQSYYNNATLTSFLCEIDPSTDPMPAIDDSASIKVNYEGTSPFGLALSN